MTRVHIIVLAHNEERRIADCLRSLPLGEAGVSTSVVVNGSRDATASIARSLIKDYARCEVIEYHEAGKARSWNRFVLDQDELRADTFIFVDGDAVVAPGSIAALEQALAANRQANAASGLPRNGRRAAYYRETMLRERSMFGDLYALRGSFVEEMRRRHIRMPDDLIGDDGLIGALAKTNLANNSAWANERLLPCAEAGFFCEPIGWSGRSLYCQYRRMLNYSHRHFQNRIIRDIMDGPGPQGLPAELRAHYGSYLARFAPRRHPIWWWFDNKALRRMANTVQQISKTGIAAGG